MQKDIRARISPYHLFLFTLLVFLVAAFIADTPRNIAHGLHAIFTSPSLLVTDYIGVGGLGAALANAVLTGLFSLSVAKYAKIKPNGSTIMAIWLTIGFSFFGKHIFSMMPIVYGVWLYSKFQREPFTNYSLVALLSSTLAPVVSEFGFSTLTNRFLSVLFALVLGVCLGFIIPIVSAATNRVHGGYNLYNVGFAAGILAMFLVAFRNSLGIPVVQPNIVSGGNNLFLAILMYFVAAMWCLFSLLSQQPRRAILQTQKTIYGHSGRLVSDYYLLYGRSTYLNMGLLGMLGITVTLVLGGQLNGITLAGICTMMGFGAFGKHLRNCIPVMAGAILFAYINQTPPYEPSNMVAILFCTGLAPIAGQYGWFWGVIAGILHLAIVSHVGQVAGGLSLYNNGFAAGFVALVLVPVILAFRRGKNEQ